VEGRRRRQRYEERRLILKHIFDAKKVLSVSVQEAKAVTIDWIHPDWMDPQLTDCQTKGLTPYLGKELQISVNAGKDYTIDTLWNIALAVLVGYRFAPGDTLDGLFVDPLTIKFIDAKDSSGNDVIRCVIPFSGDTSDTSRQYSNNYTRKRV